MEILIFIRNHWVEWLFTAAVALLGYGYRAMYTKLKEEQAKNKAIAEGVQALLRESIVANYNRYLEKGYVPIYAKESIKRVYIAYHDLEGNDVATSLYNKILQMPEEPEA